MGNIAQRHRCRPTYNKIICHGLRIALHARAQNTLADEVHGSDHKDREDDPDNRTDGVGGLRRWLLSGIAGNFI